MHYRYAISYIVRITIKYTIAVLGMPTCPRQASSVKGRNGHLGTPPSNGSFLSSVETCVAMIAAFRDAAVAISLGRLVSFGRQSQGIGADIAGISEAGWGRRWRRDSPAPRSA
jgi:hypothetical protein